MMIGIRENTLIYLIWLILIITIFGSYEGFTTNKFIRISFGPHEDLQFLGFYINSWPRWSFFNTLIMFDTLISSFIIYMNYPVITNNILNPKKKDLLFSRLWLLAIINLFHLYVKLSHLITIYIAFTQIDTLLFRIYIDLCVSILISTYHINNKIKINSQPSLTKPFLTMYEQL